MRRSVGQPSAFERRLTLIATLIGVPGTAIALTLLWTGDYAPRLQWGLTIILIASWAGLVAMLREVTVRPVQTISNMLAALLAGDYSVRVRDPKGDDALALLIREVNALGDTLREQRLGALDATSVLRKVMAEIDVAVFTFDDDDVLRLVNRAGERLLARPAERILGHDVRALGLAEYISPADDTQTFDATFAGGSGRYELRVSDFRQGGVPHRLVVLTDLSHTLREEEQQAWRRLIRVLGHEINNSLAPIKSIAESLQIRLDRYTASGTTKPDALPEDARTLLETTPAPHDPDLEDVLSADLARGLAVIASRADALSRFMTAHARLARLPPPALAPLDVGGWIHRVTQLETRLAIEVVEGPSITIHADADQLEQLLINLVRNAVDAVHASSGPLSTEGVRVGWGVRSDDTLEVWVEDEGPGLPETHNLFVPFFTTKPEGTGIGLVLSRQIADAHDGELTLQDREDRNGCRALLRLPIHTPSRS